MRREGTMGLYLRQTSGTSSGNEWQQVTTNDNEWYNELQRVTASGTTKEDGRVHFKEWMIAILTVTKTDIQFQEMDGFK